MFTNIESDDENTSPQKMHIMNYAKYAIIVGALVVIIYFIATSKFKSVFSKKKPIQKPRQTDTWSLSNEIASLNERQKRFLQK